jgi:hypothetical protein
LAEWIASISEVKTAISILVVISESVDLSLGRIGTVPPAVRQEVHRAGNVD